ncbi:hypothetical protein QBC47DRAFT_464015 [Echria macrotheca]|uniref:Ankyrin repeat protein n=1 Tax=Echria macrotheca TaxID=438768 RepID=A0AAJ0B414_9PEZI|nr:hypothetical protein QBC47DRAFT_464015 [Echria macrotheca]
MADPISLISLASLAGDLLVRLYDYVQTVRSAKKEMYELYTEVLALKGIIEQIDQRQKASAARPLQQTQQQYADTLVATATLLDSMLDDLTSKKQSKLSSLSWTRSKTSVQEQVAKVERAKSFFVLVLMDDTSASQHDVLALVKSISTALSIDRQEKEAQENKELYDRIRKWLAPFSPESLHAKAGAGQQLGTGSWFLNGPFSAWLSCEDDKFRAWCAQEREAAKRLKNAPKDDVNWGQRHPMNEDSRLLFLAGPSGCGKTVLCAAAINTAKRAVAENDSVHVAYYYFSASHPTSRSCGAMLGGILAQLLRHNDSVLATLQAECDDPSGTVPGEKQLLHYIAECCNAMYGTYLFVDAANEAQSPSDVFRLLYRILSQAERVRIFVTSSTAMMSLSVYRQDVQANVYVSPEHSNEDMRAYISQRLETDEPACFLSQTRKQDLASNLVAQAEGVFRYVTCQLDSYCRLHTGREVIRAINKMPEDLFKVYAESLSQVPPQDRDMVREALVWVVYAVQPLTLGALAEAVVLELDDTYMDAELRLPNPREILTMCRGLLDHDQETAQVFLSHASIRDFLSSSSPTVNADGNAWYYLGMDRLAAASINKRIFDKCITYLMFDEFATTCHDLVELDSRRDRYPLLDYAARAWPSHYPGGDSTALESILRLFGSRNTESGGHYASWVQALIREAPPRVALATDPLYYAASFGLLPVVRHIAQTNGSSAIDQPGGRALATPLQVAVFRGHRNVAHFLLENGADPNSKNADGLTNLQCARMVGDERLKELLIRYGAAEEMMNSEEAQGSSRFGRSHDKWAKCCQCGGDFAWGTAMYGGCYMCTHKICEDCKNVARKR